MERGNRGAADGPEHAHACASRFRGVPFRGKRRRRARAMKQCRSCGRKLGRGDVSCPSCETFDLVTLCDACGQHHGLFGKCPVAEQQRLLKEQNRLLQEQTEELRAQAERAERAQTEAARARFATTIAALERELAAEMSRQVLGSVPVGLRNRFLTRCSVEVGVEGTSLTKCTVEMHVEDEIENLGEFLDVMCKNAHVQFSGAGGSGGTVEVTIYGRAPGEREYRRLGSKRWSPPSFRRRSTAKGRGGCGTILCALAIMIALLFCVLRG